MQADLEAVIAWASPDEPVHLVAHGWGSIQTWEAITDPRLAGAIASFTSISGPCLDHLGHWLRAQWRSDRAALTKQLRKSGYIALFQLPLLAPLAWGTLLARRWPKIAARIERQALAINPTLTRDGADGIRLYRANVLARLLRQRRAQTPVQLITPQRDAFVGPGFAAGLERWIDDLTVTPIDAGHWAPLTHPGAIAAHCTAFVHAHARAESRLSA